MKEQERLDPSQEVVLRMDALMKGLRRKQISGAHRDRVIQFLKEHRARYLTPSDAFPSDEWYRDNVSNLSDGALEADSNALVSRGEDTPGAYVETWAWVDAPTCEDCGEAVLNFEDKICKECKEKAEEEDEEPSVDQAEDHARHPRREQRDRVD